MSGESNVGLRILIMGKDAALAGVKELTAAAAKMNAEIAAGGASSKVAAAGYKEQEAGLVALQAKMDLYQKNLAGVAAETDAVAKVGKTAFFTLAAAAAVWTAESTKWATSYQQQLTRLNTQAGVHLSIVKQIGAYAMANAASVGLSPTAFVQAAYHPASAQMSKSQVESITMNAARLAAMGGPGTNVEDTTNAVTGIAKIYGLGGKKSAAFANAVIGSGNMSVSDFNALTGTGIFEAGKTFGVSKESIGGLAAYLTDRSVGAAQAGTRSRMGISLLAAPSAASMTALTAAGLSSATAKGLQASTNSTLAAAGLSTSQLSYALRDNSGGGGVVNALTLLKSHLTASGMNETEQGIFISKIFGGGRSGSAMEAGYENLSGLSSKTQQIKGLDKTSTFNKDWIEQTKTLHFEMEKLGATVETLGTQFGLKLLPPLTKAVGMFTSLLSFMDKNKGVALALGGAVTAVLVPAMGVYLKGALLSTNGSIMRVVRGYGNLIGIQSEAQRSIAGVDGALAGEDASLAVNDRALLTNSADSRGLGGGGLGGSAGIGSKLLKGGMYAAGGVLAGGMIRGSNGSTINPNQTNSQKLRTFFGDTAEGAGIGAGIGSIIPGVGTVIGGVAGGAAGALYSERHTIGSTLKSGWDDLFGGGQHASTAPNSRPLTVHNYVTVEIDGKEVTKKVVKQTKRTAARS